MNHSSESKVTPAWYLADFEKYVESHGFKLSPGAVEIARTWEELGARINQVPGPTIVLQCFFSMLKPLRSLMLRKGADPDTGIGVLNKSLLTKRYYDEYDTDSYSEEYRGGFRAWIADYSITAARRHHRTEILDLDLLEGYLDAHDEDSPPIDNSNWADEALHVSFNTLSHIFGRYHASMWLKFDDIRRELDLQTADAARKEPLDAAPPHLKQSVLSLLADYPDYRRNCFLIMPFRETAIHREIHSTLKGILESHGIKLLRADDREYSEDLFGNIEAHMYGCRFGIAVHERVISDAANPNVALEVGYMLGLQKQVCLLKEQTVVSLPSDLSGRLYVPFDSQNIEASLRTSMQRWLIQKRIIPAEKSPH